MVVIVIIGLLATIVIINVMPATDRAADTKTRADIATLEQAIEMYRLTRPTLSDRRRAAGADRRPLYPPPAQRSLGQSLSLQRARARRGALPDSRRWAPTGAKAAPAKMPTSAADPAAGALTLLAFVDRLGGAGRWLLLEETRSRARRRAGLAASAAATVLAVPGDEVTVHWLELAGGLAGAGSRRGAADARRCQRRAALGRCTSRSADRSTA